MAKLFNLKNSSFAFAFLLLLLFPFSAAAGPLETIANILIAIPYVFIGVILLYFVLLTWAFALIMGWLLDVVISPSFISLSYTNPATNQIIEAGLNITQSFVNLMLVVVLVYTALSIALRINETAAKKMLTRLIVVALLVNFIPVFAGLVVDAANIAMYYFLEPLGDSVSGVLTQVKTYIDMLLVSLKRGLSGLSEKFGLLIMLLTQIMINVSMGIAFLLYAGIFLFRYIAIWTLVILAPIAFVSWIFPSGRMQKIWGMWFNQFIEWSIIGIPLAFFLYLAMGSFTLITAVFKQQIMMPGEPAAAGFFNDVFPFFVVVAFLFLGFGVGLQTSAMGTTAIIKGFQAAHKKAQIETLKAAGSAALVPVRFAGAKIAAGAAGVKGTYGQLRLGGATPFQAMWGTPQVYWQRRGQYWQAVKGTAQTAIRPAQWPWRRMGAAAVSQVQSARKGIWNVAKETATAGIKAAKIKPPRIQAICPQCGELGPSDARFCRSCGAQLLP